MALELSKRKREKVGGREREKVRERERELSVCEFVVAQVYQ